MVKRKKTVSKSDTKKQSRPAYSSPRLKEFGSVGTLTQAGSMGMAEMGAGGGAGQLMKQRP